MCARHLERVPLLWAIHHLCEERGVEGVFGLGGVFVTMPQRVAQRDLGWTVTAVLIGFGALTALAVIALWVGADRTADVFAWTIRPPLSAAFLGAGYGAGCVLVIAMLRDGRWAAAGGPWLTIWVFTLFTLLATVLHRDRLHLNDDGLPRLAAWFWVIVYVVVPATMCGVLIARSRWVHRRAGAAVPRARTDGTGGLPRPIRLSLLMQAVLLSVCGAGLVLAVDPLLQGWPWALTPFMARITGAWVIAFAVAAVWAVRTEAHLLVPAALGYTAFGTLELTALALFLEDARRGPALAGYVVMVVWVGLTGVAGWRAATRAAGTSSGARGAS